MRAGVAVEAQGIGHVGPVLVAQTAADRGEAFAAVEAKTQVPGKGDQGAALVWMHGIPVGDGLGKVGGIGVDALIEQQIGLLAADRGARRHRFVVEGGEAVADRPGITTAGRIGIGLGLKTLKAGDQLAGGGVGGRSC